MLCSGFSIIEQHVCLGFQYFTYACCMYTGIGGVGPVSLTLPTVGDVVPRQGVANMFNHCYKFIYCSLPAEWMAMCVNSTCTFECASTYLPCTFMTVLTSRVAGNDTLQLFL